MRRVADARNREQLELRNSANGLSEEKKEVAYGLKHLAHGTILQSGFHQNRVLLASRSPRRP